MKLFLPKQHGAWAMLIIPYWLGVIDGGFMWKHIPFFIGWLLLYLGTYPLLLLFKRKKIRYYTKWTLFYMIPALMLFLIPLMERPSIIYFGLLMLPFFMINAYYTSKNQDRAFMNDLSAVFAFSMAGLASSYLTHGLIDIQTFVFIFLTSVLFFVGCTFYVKTMIREKKNKQFKWISWCYHIVLVLFCFGAGVWIVALAFIPSLLRAIILYGKPLSPKQIGIYEIINSALFFTIAAYQIVLLT
ncbi:YwiC-like family protein [Bacillus sp. sid0103]|uniref:YwiC-like family protein n=1 Tax=Bacillus sp. sid0103 TaxID=2856337 RepID=UPI001C455AAC|nr:YwiC-like family protein [Bacillus sp. sid0103]MBV7508537.1 YwiC-like family protein [Bacillus sp. sid0103]